jgi:quercetin dioxygenase-like cupin family protein
MTPVKLTRIQLAAAVFGIGGAIMAAAWRAEAAAAQAQSYFVGGTPTSVDATAVRTTRLKFKAGSRSNWHTHTNGQLLMVEEGKGLTQERNGPVREMLPWQPFFTRAGVEHWHGAAPDVDMLQLTIYEGQVNWLGAVSDKEYLTKPSK